MNPFRFGRLVEGDDFVGRQREVDRLYDQLSGFSQNVNLVGETRIGKSSLARRVAGMIERSPRRLLVHQTLTVVGREVDFFDILFTKTVDAFEDASNEVAGPLAQLRQTVSRDGREAYSRCERGLKLLAAMGVKTLWFLDEFDGLSKYDSPRDITWRLRELVSDPVYGVACVAISRRPIADIEERISGVSNLKGTCPPVYLKPMITSDVALLAERGLPEWHLSSDDQAELWFLSGGHPYLAQMVLFAGWSSRSLLGVREEVLPGILEYYDRELRILHQEDGLFDSLLQAAVGPRWSLRPEQLVRLEAYGLINKQGDTYSAHFGVYLARSSRQSSTMDFMRTTEMEVRDLIEDRATASLGANWMGDLASTTKSIDLFKQQAESLQRKDQQQFGGCTDRLLDYIYFMELWEIIYVLWDVFEPCFPHRTGNRRQYWRGRFELLAKVRNPAMHHREAVIPATQLLTAKAYSAEILDAIRATQRRVAP